MFNTRLDYLICEYMVYCRSRQLRAKTMNSYEQGLPISLFLSILIRLCLTKISHRCGHANTYQHP